MRMWPCLAVVTTFVLSQNGWLHAEEPDSLSPGMRLRVTAPAQTPKRIVGTLASADPSSLTIQTSGKQIVVPREVIQAVEISERRGWKKRGALIGAGVAVLAALAIAASEDYSPHEFCLESCATVTNGSFASEALLGIAILGLPGAGLGAALAPGERWVAAKTPTLGMQHTQAEGGLRVGISVRF